jgi:hypothetical protein
LALVLEQIVLERGMGLERIEPLEMMLLLVQFEKHLVLY